MPGHVERLRDGFGPRTPAFLSLYLSRADEDGETERKRRQSRFPRAYAWAQCNSDAERPLACDGRSMVALRWCLLWICKPQLCCTERRTATNTPPDLLTQAVTKGLVPNCRELTRCGRSQRLSGVRAAKTGREACGLLGRWCCRPLLACSCVTEAANSRQLSYSRDSITFLRPRCRLRGWDIQKPQARHDGSPALCEQMIQPPRGYTRRYV